MSDELANRSSRTEVPLYFIIVSEGPAWRGCTYSYAKRGPKGPNPSPQRRQEIAHCFPKSVLKSRGHTPKQLRLARGHWWRNRKLGRITQRPRQRGMHHWTTMRDKVARNDSETKNVAPRSLPTQVKPMANVTRGKTPYLRLHPFYLHSFAISMSSLVCLHQLSSIGSSPWPGPG